MSQKSWDGSTLTLDYIEKIMPFIDQNNIHYLAWTWNKWGCNGHQLISDFDGSINTGCDHAEDLYAAMQKSLAQNPGQPGTPVSPIPTTAPDCSKKPLGDADCDTKTTLIDFEFMRRDLAGNSVRFGGDFNADGEVTLDDYKIWLSNFLF